MNDFETMLRATLDDDVATDPHRLMTDVRRGARRRRHRRRAVVAAAAAAIVATGSFGATRLLTDDVPDPADESGATSPTHVRDLAAGSEGLLVASYEPDCECNVIWRRDGDGWHQVHSVAGQFGDISMGPSGVHGVLASGAGVRVTHDSGMTWSPLEITAPDVESGGETFAWAGDGALWFLTSKPGPWRATAAWRGPAEGDTVAPFGLPDFEVAGLGDLGDSIVAVRRDRPNVTTPFVSVDGGRTWQERSWPCRDDEGPGYMLGTVILVSCEEGSGEAVVHRSTDLRTWEPWQRHAAPFRIRELDEERYWAETPDGTLIASREGVEPADLPVDSTSVDVVTDAVDGTHYMAASDTIYESTDGGITWQELED